MTMPHRAASIVSCAAAVAFALGCSHTPPPAMMDGGSDAGPNSAPFADPTPVAIQGWSGDAMEPFLAATESISSSTTRTRPATTPTCTGPRASTT
jgi:hypothetical protein